MAYSTDAPGILAALCNTPDEETALALARRLVDNRLAACVNILPPCRSIYRWQDQIEDDAEIPILIKTSADKADALKEAVQKHHPYDTPELIFFAAADGLLRYLQWVSDECKS